MRRSARAHAVVTLLLVVLLVPVLPSTAKAFCGFYVSGAETRLYNDATVVSMMREGDQTVMAMQNNYRGPAEDFALVIPVSEVLTEERVKTLEDQIFEKLDRLTAPRLVEYWQRDPCEKIPPVPRTGARPAVRSGAETLAPSSEGGDVRIEAAFDVDEYEIKILSSGQSKALESWLTERDYNIPEGAAAYFRPYIQKGRYFFVAKVDVEKVDYREGRALLSPLRFHYESDQFRLPVRLGLINSSGSQDLFVMILSRNQRYRVANHPNVKAPTNVPVSEKASNSFGGVYDELFSRLLSDQPGAVVTEYAWNASSCDPCPIRPLRPAQLATLGADVVSDKPGSSSKSPVPRPGPPRGQSARGDWVVTRLHTRYSDESLGEDLVFEKAEPIRGGSGRPVGREGRFRHQSARSAATNRFQTRFVIRHAWKGDVDCEDPNWGRWGGPPSGAQQGPKAASNLAFETTEADVSLSSAVEQTSLPGLGPLDRKPPSDESAPHRTSESGGGTTSAPSKGASSESSGAAAKEDCTGCRTAGKPSRGVGLLVVVAAAALVVRRRRRTA